MTDLQGAAESHKLLPEKAAAAPTSGSASTDSLSGEDAVRSVARNQKV